MGKVYATHLLSSFNLTWSLPQFSCRGVTSFVVLPRNGACGWLAQKQATSLRLLFYLKEQI
jgi:hypothetical protein